MGKSFKLPDGSWVSREKAAKVYYELGCVDHPGHRVTMACPSMVCYRGLQRSFRVEGNLTFQTTYDASWPPSKAKEKVFLLLHGSSISEGKRINSYDPYYSKWRHYYNPSSKIYDPEFRAAYDAAFPPKPGTVRVSGSKQHHGNRLYTLYVVDGCDFIYILGCGIFYYTSGSLTCISPEDLAYLKLYDPEAVVRVPISGPIFVDTPYVDAALSEYKRSHINSK